MKFRFYASSASSFAAMGLAIIWGCCGCSDDDDGAETGNPNAMPELDAGQGGANPGDDDDDTQGGGAGGDDQGGAGGSNGGSGGDEGMETGSAPVVLRVTFTPAADCMTGVASDVTITLELSDEESPVEELRVNYSLLNCTGANTGLGNLMGETPFVAQGCSNDPASVHNGSINVGDPDDNFTRVNFSYEGACQTYSCDPNSEAGCTL